MPIEHVAKEHPNSSQHIRSVEEQSSPTLFALSTQSYHPISIATRTYKKPILQTRTIHLTAPGTSRSINKINRESNPSLTKDPRFALKSIRTTTVQNKPINRTRKTNTTSTNLIQHETPQYSWSGSRALTVTVLDEVIEGVAVAVVGELVVASGELLQALSSDAVEVTRELRELRQNHRSPRDEAVDQRLLSHLHDP